MWDPWKILNLERRTTTERDVKAAYARLLKQHRPDQDPEGFQRVRQAYDAALAELRSAGGEKPDMSRMPAMQLESDAPASQRRPEEATPSRRTLIELTKSVEAALQAQNAGLLWDAIESALRVDLPELEFEDAHAQISVLVQGHSELLHKAVSRDRLLRSLESDHTSLFRFMCGHWRSTGNTSAPPVVASHVLAQKTLMVSLSGAMALADLGALVGFRHPDLARKLADLAYRHLPVEIRDMFVSMVDREIVLGQVFFAFPKEQQKFWLRRLRNPDDDFDWHDAESHAAFDYLLKARSITWPGLPLLLNLLPPPVAKTLHDSMMEVAKKAEEEYQFGGGVLPASMVKGVDRGVLVLYTVLVGTSFGGWALYKIMPFLRHFFGDIF